MGLGLHNVSKCEFWMEGGKRLGLAVAVAGRWRTVLGQGRGDPWGIFGNRLAGLAWGKVWTNVWEGLGSVFGGFMGMGVVCCVVVIRRCRCR